MHDDVVVVGAGMGGLAAAISLAAAGRRVLVLDALPIAGGKLNIAVVDGVEVDTGPTALCLPGVLADVLAMAGRRVESELRLFRPDPATVYRFPSGVELRFRARIEDTVAEVERTLGPRAREELQAFLRYAATLWGTAAPTLLFGPRPSFARALAVAPKAPGILARLDPLRSVARAIDAHVREPHLRAILWRCATANGADPRVAPAALNCHAHVELGLGVYGVHGGMYQVTRALERAARALGVRFHFNARVALIQRGPGGVEGVVLSDGRRVETRHVVVNAEPRHLYDQLLTPPIRTRVAPPSTSGWTGILRARRRRDRPAHAVLMPVAYERELDDLRRGRAPREPAVYVCAQERAHHRRGWAQHEPLLVVARAPAVADRATSDVDAAALEAAVLGRLVGAGMIDRDDAVVWARTPRMLADTFFDSLGAFYGLNANSHAAAFARHDNVDARVPGLYLASASAHPGGGVPYCLQSGLMAASACLARGGQREVA